jgi:predicted trehalose synthase
MAAEEVLDVIPVDRAAAIAPMRAARRDAADLLDGAPVARAVNEVPYRPQHGPQAWPQIPVEGPPHARE